ncbi:hypothetical protein [Dongia sedimenti]|uniref:Uncharacterized protein n=1 Tax=Dongia sedimenti TaxID=3064282 RepID=A0ABU0YVE1_9PROT|nr:hypothetical protein [Rhodospirillaceae bacterium R-7]
MSDLENLRTVRQSLVVRRRDLASRGAMSPADGGRSATQIRNLQGEIDAIDAAIDDEIKAAAEAAASAA